MPELNKTVLQRASAAVLAGDHEGFLAHCTDDVEWTFVGERTLDGKDAVRRYPSATYLEPPRVTVAQLITEGGFAHGLDDRHGRAPPVAGRLVRVRQRPRGVTAAPRDAGLPVAVSID